MLQLSAVLSSDTINRYGSRFASAEMGRALQAHWLTGLPSTISHDAHRFAGWTLPTAVTIAAAATRLHGISLIPESAEEQARLENRYQRYLALRIEEETKPHISALRTLLAPYLRGDEEPHTAAATTMVGPELARRVAPALFSTEDKDGLVDLRGLKTIQPGVYKQGELVLFAHHFFRRSLSRWNNLNAAVLSALDGLRDVKEATIRIRLDPDMVGLAASVTRALEFDYWYGPKFDDNLTSIPVGVTRHEATERERHFFGISRTEFWWQSRDDQHILEAEEVRDLPTLGVGATAFGCRYVHSIVDEHDGRVFHLDGAIRSYDEAALLERLDLSIAEAGRKTQYTKLWRADGAVPLSRWKQLVHDYFRDNPLVGEYLSPKVSAVPEKSSSSVTSASATARQRFVPHMIDAEDGPNCLLSLHELESKTEQAREFCPLETITALGVARDVIDADAVELRKALIRRGQDIHIPQDALHIAFEDRYLTFPLIRHQSAAAVGETLNALGDLLSGWARSSNDDRALAFSLAAPFDQVEVRCAVYGHVKDLPNTLEALRRLFASQSLVAVVDWVDRYAGEIRRADEENTHDLSRFDALMTPHQTYRLVRKQIAPEDIRLREEQGVIVHQLRLPADDDGLVAAVRSHKLRPAFAWVIEESECSQCSKPYFTCSCSKVLDANVVQTCKKAQIAYAFWTDRPA